jgi:hypothetical protein
VQADAMPHKIYFLFISTTDPLKHLNEQRHDTSIVEDFIFERPLTVHSPIKWAGFSHLWLVMNILAGSWKIKYLLNRQLKVGSIVREDIDMYATKRI